MSTGPQNRGKTGDRRNVFRFTAGYCTATVTPAGLLATPTCKTMGCGPGASPGGICGKTGDKRNVFRFTAGYCTATVTVAGLLAAPTFKTMGCGPGASPSGICTLTCRSALVRPGAPPA